jgi:inhibitor of KinA sporulation pathway (predicted exonuclease)
MKPYLCIVDLEATCWPGNDRRREEMEIIEIGAILADAATLKPLKEFDRLVRPVRHPTLSPFCTELTTITQAQVDAADPFPTVLAAFRAWLGDPRAALFTSWGRYDFNQLKKDCAFHRVDYPFDADHWNAKEHFAAVQKCRPCGISAALKMLRLAFEGTHHRGLDDARMILRLLQSTNPNRGL